MHSPIHRRIILVLLLVIGLAPLAAQYDLVADSLVVSDEPLTLKEINASPKKALLWSIIPGGGQVYNRAWWKVPLVYGGLLGIVAVADYNQNLFSRYTTAIEQRCLGDGLIITIPYAECIPTPNEPGLSEVSTQGLISAKNSSNKQRQTAYVFVIVGYVLQAVEAFTDAHLKDFDIDDDLSLQIGPVIGSDTGAGAGLTLPIGTGRAVTRQEMRVRQLSGR
ncbi:DUF5683 domain-containing protein [Lewinella sp. IMCC34191]|uniref:DUF5683 domain-containing protein n=1 Tax=Lewinella sp. IMCC34191 TaxID=2259172 RepID=UPI000E220502|nr:DUF5683 domain-containing protein [Lewinella sp. IMCC34191]